MHVLKNKGSTRSVDNVISQLRVYCCNRGIEWLGERAQRKLKNTVGDLKFEDKSCSRRKKALLLDKLLQIVDICIKRAHAWE